MKKVIRFMNLRVLFVIISIVLLGGGIVGTIIRGGFNLGIDFQAGLSMRVQLAEAAFSVAYNGEGSASFNINRDNVTFDVTGTETNDLTYVFRFDDYTNLGTLSGALRSVPGVSLELLAADGKRSSRLLNINDPVEILGDGYTAKILPQADSEVFAPIGKMRDALSSLGNAQITQVGVNVNQEYLIRTQDTGEIENFSEVMSNRIQTALSAYFTGSTVLINQTDYVGPRFSKDLGKQAVYLTSIALFLILGYAWFRFKLGYAVSAIIALIHDALFMVGFIGTFQIEVSTATIAAVLTIVGYSINDTIVIYDRVRENSTLMRDSNFETIINTSISQSMTRSLMTSFTTILAVAAIYIFAVGTVKLFALNMIIGIVIGTYSSMFIASPILLGWTKSRERRKKSGDIKKYGKSLEKLTTPIKAGEEAAVGTDGPVQASDVTVERAEGEVKRPARQISSSIAPESDKPQFIERKPPKPKKKPKVKKR